MASDTFIKFDGIDGESTDDKHQKWIEVMSYSWGVHQAATTVSTAGSAPSARADFTDLSITKELDKATPKLFIHCASGQPIAKVEVDFCRAAGDTKESYMKYTMEEVIISSVSTGGGGDGSLPIETVTMNYGKLKQEYFETKRDTGKGASTGAVIWNLKTNKKE